MISDQRKDELRKLYRDDPICNSLYFMDASDENFLYFLDRILTAERIDEARKCAEIAEAEKYSDKLVAQAEREGSTELTTYNKACSDIAAEILARTQPPQD